MVARILVSIGLVFLGAGFIFFAANVIWLGTREFFRIYGPRSRSKGNSIENNTNTNKENK